MISYHNFKSPKNKDIGIGILPEGLKLWIVIAFRYVSIYIHMYVI